MRKLFVNLFIVGAFLGLLLGAGWYVFKGDAVRRPGSLYVPTGADFGQLADSLQGRIRFGYFFDLYAGRIGVTGNVKNVKPGHYVLTDQNIVRLARMLNLGEQTPVDVVVRQSRLPAILASRVSQQLEADSASLHAAMRDPEILKQYGFGNELELFSIFIPNTYEMWWTDSPEAFVARMKREYDRFWNDERVAKLPRTRLTKMQVASLAAILNEETQKTDEMSRMAGVYINRLRSGMPLQADPTVKYAMGDFALRRILNRHLKTPSPYNTYVNKGLPPTPITMASIAALDAVLNFEENDYLYFCAKEDFSGYHNFAATYSQHLVNARRYAAALDKRGIK